MANTITYAIPTLLAQGLMALRQNSIMPRLVNQDYNNLGSQKGNAINVPIPSAVTATNVTPSMTLASNQDMSPTQAVVTLDFWKEATFQLSDSDVANVIDGIVPMQASEAIKALANAIDKYILGKHVGIFGMAGTPGTTPFSGSLNMAATARKLLSLQAAPVTDRRAVIDPSAEANLLINAAVLNPYGSQQVAEGGIVQGQIDKKLGFDWYVDQNIATYTPGTGWASGFIASTVAGVAAQTTLNVINATASGTILVGDIFTVVGDTSAAGCCQQYVVTKAATASATVAVVLTFYPGLKAAVATGATLVVVSVPYVPNLAFHRDAFVWASRPLNDVQGLGNIFQSAVDPISGCALRLELSRQYKQTTFSFDVLGGAALIRPELAVKIAG